MELLIVIALEIFWFLIGILEILGMILIDHEAFELYYILTKLSENSYLHDLITYDS